MKGDLRAKFIVWWRINVCGPLRLGEFLRFVLYQGRDKL